MALKQKYKNKIDADDMYEIGDKVPINNGESYIEIMAIDGRGVDAKVTLREKDGEAFVESMDDWMMRLINLTLMKNC